MKKKTFKRAGAAVLSMAMLLSFGAIGATTAYAEGTTTYKVTISDPQETGVQYQYIKIADATEKNGRYEYGTVQAPFANILKTNTTTKNIELKEAIVLNGTNYAAGTVVSTATIGNDSAVAHDLAAALLTAAANSTFAEIPTAGLTPGYYLLKDTNTTTTGSQPILLSITNKDENITAKATKIPFAKTITSITPATTSQSTVADKIATDGKSGVAEAKAVVTYQLYTKFPTYSSNLDGDADITDFTITDIPEDTITIQKNTNDTKLAENVKVYLGSVDDANLVDASNYTLKADVSNDNRTIETTKKLFDDTAESETAGKGFTIVFDDSYVLANGGKNVYITFDADVSANPDVETDKNANEATLDYNNNYWTGGSNKNPDFNPEEEESPENKKYNDEDTPNAEEHDEADVYATYVVVNKQDGNGAVLPGASFNLYSLTDGTKTLVGTYTHNGTGDTQEDKDASATQFKFTGLAEGTYVIEETKVPNGYAKADDITFKVTATNELEAASGKTKYLGNFTYSNNADNTNTTNTLNVKNYAGAALPGTGGMGTILFTVGGAAIVLLAGTMFVIYMKKRKVEE